MARVIPKQVIEEIRFRNDIVDVVGGYLGLKKTGATFKALCPFHKEKTPSFHVNPQRQIYHCFGCGAGGDAFSFVMQVEGVDFMTAARMLAEKAGIALDLEEDAGAGSEKTELYRLHAAASDLYHRALLGSKRAGTAREYVKRRELSDETVEKFRVGYAPDMWDGLLKWARKQGFSDNLLLKSGLATQREGGEGGRESIYDRFRNRLIFPITDEQGRVIAFSGRALDESVKGAKYINSPETPLFRKSRVLYALDKARRSIVESREAILCEGPIDVIRCHQCGFPAAVASQGTAFTEDHVRTLRRYADTVVIAFDPDQAGQDAAVRAAGLFTQSGLAVRVAVLPTGEDPDTLLCKRGPAAFTSIIEAAQSAVAFQIGVLGQRENLRTEIGTMRAARAVLETISRSPNAVQRARLVQETAQRLKLPVSALHDDLRYMLQRSLHGKRREDRQEDTTTQAVVPREEALLCEHLMSIVDKPSLGDLVSEYLPLDKIASSECRTVVRAALQAARTGRDVQEELRDNQETPEAVLRLAAAAMAAPTRIGAESSHEAAVQDVILRIWQKEIRKRLEATDAADAHRRWELKYDLDRLKTWETGAPIIEMALAEADPVSPPPSAAKNHGPAGELPAPGADSAV